MKNPNEVLVVERIRPMIESQGWTIITETYHVDGVICITLQKNPSPIPVAA